MPEITEAVLIDIEHRFARLEKAVEEADIFHAERVEHFNQKIDRLELGYRRHGDYNRWCRESGEAGAERDKAQIARNDMQLAVDACRADLTQMLEAIRKILV